MNQIQFHDTANNTEYNIPIASGWDDLTASDLLFLGKHYPYQPTWEFLSRLFLQLIRIRKLPRSLKKIIRKQIEAEQLILLFEDLDNFKWVFDLEENKLAKNLFPEISIGIRKYKGWDDELKNLTIEQYSFADTFYLNCHKTNDKGQLNYLIATIYQREFDSDKIEPIARHVAKLPEVKRNALLLNYIGARNYFTHSFPKIFRKTPNIRQAENEGWGPVLIRLTRGDLTKHEQINKMNLWYVLRHLTVEKADADKLMEESAFRKASQRLQG
jgi:hypothetical protein